MILPLANTMNNKPENKNTAASGAVPSLRYEKRSTDFYYRSDRGRTISLGCRPHLHYHIEFFYLIEGKVSAWVDSVEYTVLPGDLLIAFPNQLHQYRSNDSSNERYSLFIVSPDFVPEFAGIFNSTLPRSSVVRNVGGFDRLTGLIGGMAQISRLDVQYRDEILRGYLTAFFGQLLPMITLDGVSPGDSHAVREVVNYCSQNYTGNLSLDLLEEELHLNKYYISHLFSSKLGIRFNDYVNSLRISHACRLLRDSELSVTEISDAVGFNTQRTFNRAFLRFRSCTPVEYRRSLADRQDNVSIPPFDAAGPHSANKGAN